MRTMIQRAMVWSAAIFLAAAGSAEAQESSKEQAADALASFRKKISGAKDEKITEAFKALAGVRHETVLKELLKWAEKDSAAGKFKVEARDEGDGAVFESENVPEVNANWEAIARISTDYKGIEESASGIAKILRSKGARKHRNADEYLILEADLERLVGCFQELNFRALAKELNPLLKHYMPNVAGAAGLAAGSLRSKETIEPLIAALKAAEEKDNPESRFLVDQFREALGKNCAVDQEKAKTMTAETWSAWWKENKASFKEPE